MSRISLPAWLKKSSCASSVKNTQVQKPTTVSAQHALSNFHTYSDWASGALTKQEGLAIALIKVSLKTWTSNLSNLKFPNEKSKPTRKNVFHAVRNWDFWESNVSAGTFIAMVTGCLKAMTAILISDSKERRSYPGRSWNATTVKLLKSEINDTINFWLIT